MRTATAELDPVDTAVLAIARGESTRLPAARPPVLGIPNRDGGYGWILGQFALLGHTDIVRNLLDAGMAVDTRGWSNFTPLDQAAMHGRAETVRLLIERGANLHDAAFDTHGPTPPGLRPVKHCTACRAASSSAERTGDVHVPHTQGVAGAKIRPSPGTAAGTPLRVTNRVMIVQTRSLTLPATVRPRTGNQYTARQARETRPRM